MPITHINDNLGYTNYKKLLLDFKEKYKKDDRKLRLDDSKIVELIKAQGNRSGISGAPIFLGDEIEADHTKPLAIGGKDSIENITMTHKDENRKKGSRMVD